MSLHIRTSVARLAQSQYLRRKANSEPLPLKVDPAVPEYSWAVYNGNNLVSGPYEIDGTKTEREMFGVLRGALEQAGYREPEAPPLATSQPTAPPVAKETMKATSEHGLDSAPFRHVTAGLEGITAEIMILKRQTALNIIEIGHRLIQAKEMVGHGNWLAYLRDKVQISDQTARNFMRIARECGANSKALLDLEPTKVYLLLEAPEEVREDLTQRAPDMTTREIEEAVRKANEAERKAKEAEAKAADAEARAKEAESKPPQVIKETVEVKVYETPPEVQQEIDKLRRDLADKQRTMEQRQKDNEKVQKMLAVASKDLETLREQANRNGLLEEELSKKQREILQLTEIQKRLGANFDDEGRDPNGGLKLMQALHPIEDVILSVIGDVQLVKRAGVGGWCDDKRLKALAKQLKQLTDLVGAILEDLDGRDLIAEFKEVD